MTTDPADGDSATIGTAGVVTAVRIGRRDAMREEKTPAAVDATPAVPATSPNGDRGATTTTAAGRRIPVAANLVLSGLHQSDRATMPTGRSWMTGCGTTVRPPRRLTATMWTRPTKTRTMSRNPRPDPRQTALKMLRVAAVDDGAEVGVGAGDDARKAVMTVRVSRIDGKWMTTRPWKPATTMISMTSCSTTRRRRNPLSVPAQSGARRNGRWNGHRAGRPNDPQNGRRDGIDLTRNRQSTPTATRPATRALRIEDAGGGADDAGVVDAAGIVMIVDAKNRALRCRAGKGIGDQAGPTTTIAQTSGVAAADEMTTTMQTMT
jgi:hypothetical protein